MWGIFFLGPASILITGAIITGIIAHHKGRSFWGWFLYGFLLLFIALPHALTIEKNYVGLDKRALQNGFKKCKYCVELIRVEAEKCPYCCSVQYAESKKETKRNSEITEWMKKNEGKTVNDYYREKNEA